MYRRAMYAFIKDVRFVERCESFEPNLNMGYILTGHGSVNEFLYKRGLSETEGCSYGFDSEDWKHILIECPFYNDIRRLNEWGVSV